MKAIRKYDVSFSGLKLGTHTFFFPVDKEFFELYETELDFENPEIEVEFNLNKKSAFMEADITTKGKVELICDYSGEKFHQEIENKFPMLIKFGEEFNDESDEVIVLPHGEHQVNIAQLIYESIMLSIPQKRVSPTYQDQDTIYIQEDIKIENKQIDPRWEKLNKLKK